MSLLYVAAGRAGLLRRLAVERERGGRKDVNGKRRVRGEEGERGLLKGGERREGKWHQ